jgi:hypothetical protein
MATPKARIGTLPATDRQAIFDAAKNLGLDPYQFGGFLSLESGFNMDPNKVGGAGGRHKGLIQFGQSEQQKYGIQGPQTRTGQIPKVLQYFQDRGFKPGMGIERAYATVLRGNPNASLNDKDSFGTSVNSAAKRFKPGGDLYANAQRVLGDPLDSMATPPPPQLPGAPTETTTAEKIDKGNNLADLIIKKVIASRLAQQQQQGIDPLLQGLMSYSHDAPRPQDLPDDFLGMFL